MNKLVVGIIALMVSTQVKAKTSWLDIGIGVAAGAAGAYVGNKLAQEPQKEPHVIIKCPSLDGNHCYIEGKQIGKAEYASSQGFSKIYDSWSISEGGVNKIVIEVGK